MTEKRQSERTADRNPDAQTAEDALTEEERSLDIGESGQFAPGRYYNQQTVSQPKRRPLDDDDIVPPGRG
jgi:hypothetical protein